MSLFKKRPLALLSLFLLLGALTAYLFFTGGILRHYAYIPPVLLGLALVAVLGVRKARRTILVSILIAMLVGYGSEALHDRILYRDIYELDATLLQTIEGTVRSVEGDPTESICTVSVSSLNGTPGSGRLRLTIRNADLLPKENDVITCNVMLVEWADPYLYRNGIAAHAVTEEAPIITGTNRQISGDIMAKWRSFLKARLEKGLSDGGYAVLSAVLLGDKEAMDDGMEQAFRRTGLSHLLALSGLHLSILGMLILHLLRRIGVPRAVSFGALFLFVSLYAAIAGFPLSLLRAAGMLLLTELGRLLRLPADAITSLFLSVSIIVLVSFGAVADVGLALSFLATLGILIAAELVTEKNENPSRGRRILNGLVLAVLTTVSATVFTLLLSVLIFGKLSLISPLSNLIVSPFLHLLLLLGPFTIVLPSLFGPFVSAIAEVMLAIISKLASPSSVYVSASYPAFIIAAILFSVFLVLLLVDTHVSLRFVRTCLASGLSALILTLCICHVFATGREYVAYTAAPGNEYLLLQCDRTVTLVYNDGGTYAARMTATDLDALRITEIDCLVIPRCTEKTEEFIVTLANRIPIDHVVLCHTASTYAATVQAAADAKGITVQTAGNGTLALAGGTTMRVRSSILFGEGNDDGFLLRLEHDGRRICYAPAAAIATLDSTATADFTGQADLVVIGDLPSLPAIFHSFGINEEATVVIADVKTAPHELIDAANTVLEPKHFLFPLK